MTYLSRKNSEAKARASEAECGWSKSFSNGYGLFHIHSLSERIKKGDYGRIPT